MTDLSLFRIYEPHELGDDGYPRVWHCFPDDTIGVKHLVRAQAGHRCVRCGHRYTPGCGTWEERIGGPDPVENYLLELFEMTIGRERKMPRKPLWSLCDESCTHDGRIDDKGRYTVRWRFPPDRGIDQGWIDGEILAPVGEHLAKSEGMTIEACWRILTVHHLNGRKHDLRWWNLISVCQRCHLWLQRRVIMERVYPFEHDEYFKPYAAGWYAYAYLGESLTREETLERMDELLALERAA